jgi:hypothetical protein
MFTWNDDVDQATVAAVSAGLDRMAQLPVVAAYHHGPDLGLRDGNWDYVVVADFATAEDFSAYSDDPDHRALIAEVIAPNLAGRAAIQYEL